MCLSLILQLSERRLSKFLTPDIPDDVQYFAWAPVGNKLVNLDGSDLIVMIWYDFWSRAFALISGLRLE